MTNLKKSSILHKILNPKLLLLIVLLGASGWIMNGQREKVRTVTFVIPSGTSQQLAAGEEVVNFPNEINLTIGVQDKLVIKNQDDAIHNFGPFVILPHSTLTKQFNTVQTYQNVCTFHQDRQMKVVVNPAPWDIF